MSIAYTTPPVDATLGYVTGRWIRSYGSFVEDPDFVAESGEVWIIATTPIVYGDPDPIDDGFVGVSPHLTVCTLNESGDLCDPHGNVGVWLIPGTYKVRAKFKSSKWPEFLFPVTTENTKENPVDLLEYSPITEIEGYQMVVSVETAEQAAASAAAALLSETNAAASETAAGLSETNAASSASAALLSETNAAASETAAGLSETNAASSASAASLSETNAAASETAAGLSETNAASSASAALLSETNAAASETAAGLSETNAASSASAASLSETNAAASETAAGLSETNAASSASAASLSETNAAASETAAGLSETNAASSASAALLSETNAAASETAAGLSETNAASSASAASLSETNAAASETAAGLSETNAIAAQAGAESARDISITKAGEARDSADAAALSAQASEDNLGAMVVDGDVVDNDLILTKHDTTTVNAGRVVGDTGIVEQETAPTNTEVLWLDPNEDHDLIQFGTEGASPGDVVMLNDEGEPEWGDFGEPVASFVQNYALKVPTAVDIESGVWTVPNHGFTNLSKVYVSGTDITTRVRPLHFYLPINTPHQIAYVFGVTADTFKLSSTPDGLTPIVLGENVNLDLSQMGFMPRQYLSSITIASLPGATKYRLRATLEGRQYMSRMVIFPSSLTEYVSWTGYVASFPAEPYSGHLWFGVNNSSSTTGNRRLNVEALIDTERGIVDAYFTAYHYNLSDVSAAYDVVSGSRQTPIVTSSPEITSLSIGFRTGYWDPLYNGSKLEVYRA